MKFDKCLTKVKVFFSKRLDFIFLITIAFVLIFFKVFSLPLIDGDSAFYSKIAKNILESGNWLTFRYIDPKDVIDKPPLAFWPIAISFKVFGINDFAATIWHSILAFATVILVFYIAKELFGRRVAFYSGLVLITSAQFFYQTRIPLQDMALTFFISLSLFCFYIFLKYRRILAYYLFVLFTSLSILVKGPVSIPLIIPVVLIYLIIQRKLPFENKKDYLIHGLAGIAIFVLLGCSWFIYEYNVLGQPFLNQYWARNVGRFFKPVDVEFEPKRDFYTLFIYILATFLPWAGFLYPGIYYLFKLRKKEYKAEIDFLLVWFFVIIGFFSISGNRKIIRYMLPFFPAISIMVGKVWNDIFELGKSFPRRILFSGLIITLIVTIPLVSLLIFGTITKFPEESLAYLPIFIPFIVSLTIALATFLIFAFCGKLKTAFYTLVILSAISYMIFINQGAKYFPLASPYLRFSKKISSMLTEKSKVATYKGEFNRFVIFYVDKPVVYLKNDKELKEFLSSPNRVFVVTDQKEDFERFRGKNKVYILDSSNNKYLFTNIKL